jgi:hypothetical protein
MGDTNIKRRKRSNAIVDNYDYRNIESENEIKNCYEEIINGLKNITLNQNTYELLLKLTKKMSDIEKKIDNFCKVEIKLDKLHKKMDEISTEKDYVIDGLKEQVFELKSHIIELENNDIKNYSNDYFC